MKRGSEIDMPIVEFSLKDLEDLTGKKFPLDEDKLSDIFQYVKGEVEKIEGNIVSVNLADGNRPDLWSVEGIARELRGALKVETGLKEYAAKNSDHRVFVNAKLESIRGYIACAVIRNLKLDDYTIRQLMLMQEKIDQTFGRNRKKTSIGLYEVNKLKWPLRYTITKPDENAFVPLDFIEKLTPKQILEKHPKGVEFGGLLKGLDRYPIFVDAEDKVLSIPPIINSNDLGKINEETKDVLVEVTGTNYTAVNQVLTIMSVALADRGGEIYQVQIDYPNRKPDITPHLEDKIVRISLAEINDWLGTKLDIMDVTGALQRARYGVSEDKDSLIVKIPCYRSDVMHAVDLIEDVAIMYGYNKIEPESISLPTTGKLSDLEKFSDKVRELAIGLGAQEILTFMLTNKEVLFRKVNLNEGPVIEVSNPVSLNHYILRNSLVPTVLEFLSKNTKKEYPQNIFEVGEIACLAKKGPETRRKFCFAASHNNADFTEIKQIAESIFRNIGKHFTTEEAEHGSFMVGRCAKAIIDGKEVGVLGEICPEVLVNFGLEMPVVVLEVDLQDIR